MKKISISLLLMAMLAVFCSVAQAQMARVRGVAKNEQGQPIQGAQIIFKNKDNGQQIKLKTDPHLVFVPATIMFLTVLSFTRIGDWARKRVLGESRI